MKRYFAIVFVAAALAAAPAAGQVGGVTLPDVSATTGGILEQVPDVGTTVGRTGLTNTVTDRTAEVRQLLRSNRAVLEADPDGQPIVRSQILAINADEAAIARARDDGFEVVAREDLDGMGALVTLRAPRNMSTRRALRRLREADPEGDYDFDHLHFVSGLPGAVAAATVGAANGRRIGLIDSGVADTGAVRAAVAAQRAFASDAPVAADHGTAVAALMVNAAPGARIYAADIYGGRPTGGSSSSLSRALAWLARERTPVINVSLVGPQNRIVQTVVNQMIARGHIIVAAVGNDGPAAAPLYPSAYDGVVGVTGVNPRHRILNEAGRGSHVDFAAPGMVQSVGMNGAVHVRGTSYAAPIVSALLAARLAAPDVRGAERAIAALRASARDLGDQGRDDTYGYGYVDADVGPVAAR